MQKYNWNYPTTMWVGENRINDIAVACKSLGILRPLLVTDKNLVIHTRRSNISFPYLSFRTLGLHPD